MRWDPSPGIRSPSHEVSLRKQDGFPLGSTSPQCIVKVYSKTDAFSSTSSRFMGQLRLPWIPHEPSPICGHRNLVVPARVICMTPKRIVVTGGAGFLGSHLCDRLVSSGAEVVAWTVSSRARKTTSLSFFPTLALKSSATTSFIRSCSKWTRFTTSPAPPPQFIISTTR